MHVLIHQLTFKTDFKWKKVRNKWACLVTLRDQKRLKLIDAKANLYIQMLGWNLELESVRGHGTLKNAKGREKAYTHPFSKYKQLTKQ